MKYFIGTDNGGTKSKAALFDETGKEIAVAGESVENISLKPSWSERDMDAMWASTARAIKQVVTESGIDASDIVGVGNTGFGNGLFLLDAASQPVRNAINSMDSRARDYITEWSEAGIGAKVLPKTMQCLWPAQPNALLRWLKDNEPEAMAKTKWVVMAKDFIRFKLTGKINGEMSDSSALSLMDNNTGQWDQELFDTWGISEYIDKMPDLIQTSDIAGGITAEAAEATGLKIGTPVSGGMFDIDACGLASGMTKAGQLSIVAGTWGNNQFISREPVIDKDLFMTSFYSIPDWYLSFEGSPTSASNFEWFANTFFDAECALTENRGKSVYEIGNELIAKSVPDANLIFLPFLLGSNVDDDASGCFFGMKSSHTRGDLARAVYEGVIFAHRWHIQRLQKFITLPECVILTGGVANSPQWLEMFADCFQLPMKVPNGSELGALGATIGAAVATGFYQDFQTACDKMVEFGRIQEPNPAMKDYYDKKFNKYMLLLKTLKPVWKELAN